MVRADDGDVHVQHGPGRGEPFRGYLLPRMNGVFGRRDWVANGVLFAVYHLHVPWAIPATLLDTFIVAYPSKRYRSALIGIAVHSAQSVLFFALALSLAPGRPRQTAVSAPTESRSGPRRRSGLRSRQSPLRPPTAEPESVLAVDLVVAATPAAGVVAAAALEAIVAAAALQDVVAAAALQRSLPPPPLILSLPEPPQTMSLPPLPLILSLPPPPAITSLPFVPGQLVLAGGPGDRGGLAGAIETDPDRDPARVGAEPEVVEGPVDDPVLAAEARVRGVDDGRRIVGRVAVAERAVLGVPVVGRRSRWDRSARRRGRYRCTRARS